MRGRELREEMPQLTQTLAHLTTQLCRKPKHLTVKTHEGRKVGLHDLTFLNADKLSSGTLWDKRAGKLPEEEFEEAGHRHDILCALKVRIPHPIKTQAEVVYETGVAVDAKEALMM